MRLLLTGLILSALAVSASAGESLAGCRSMLEDEARLDCYDRLADRVSEADGQAQDAATSDAASASEPDVSVAAQTVTAEEQDSVADEQRFGFEFAVKDALQEISSQVVAVRKNARGGQVLTLENEQMWQQATSERSFFREGDQITVFRGAFTAFYIGLAEKGRRYRFTRVK